MIRLDVATYINIDPWQSENGDLLVPVCRYEPEELVPVLVPLDRVQLLTLHVVETPQCRVLATKLVTWNGETA